MYANGPGLANAAVAFRAFSNSLAPSRVFKIKYRSYGINTSNNASLGGFALRNGNVTNSTTDYNTGYRFAFFYQGGGADTFTVSDNNGYATGLGFNQNPFEVEFTLLTANTYRLVIRDTNGVSLASFDGQTLTGSGTIDSIALFALQTDGDQVFNSMQIESTSLVPPDIQNLQPNNGQIYATGTSFSFDVNSAFSTVPAAGITLIMNNATQSNLTITGGGTASAHVVWNTALQANNVYAGTIIAVDSNGNRSTNNFSFNTWTAANPFIEAEDYNFNSGHWLDNTVPPQPNQGYAGLLGSNGIDYLEYDLTGTNHPNVYRPGDLPQVENSGDLDHDNFTANGFQDYDLAFTQNGEWENYTRRLSGGTYMVEARMSGFGANPVMLMERLTTQTVTSSNQPRAALGTFVCPSDTGGVQNYTFVAMKDIFSNPVLINYSGTNTFRLTCIGSDGSYNLSYLTLVPATAAGTLRPYISSGFPYPGATGVGPDQQISFTIANRQTSVSPGTIQLLLNAVNVTGGIQLSNNSAGSIVTYQPVTLMNAGTNTIQVIFGDGSVTQTNTWQFTVGALPVLPTAWALPVGTFNNKGFSLFVAKADDNATNTDLPPSVARAEAQVLGKLTNSVTGLPYANQAQNSGFHIEPNVIQYALDSIYAPQFASPAAFPDIAAGTTNNVAMQALMYVHLAPGVYTFAVHSDDGFKFTAGPTTANTNLVLGIADFGRAPTETAFGFIVQATGLYPMRLLYFKSQLGGGGVELYSINRSSGVRTLLNDQSNPNSIKTFWGDVLAVQRIPGNAVLSWSDPSFKLQSAPAAVGVYTTIPGATNPSTNAIGTGNKFYRLIH
jgi:hypothetical protein